MDSAVLMKALRHPEPGVRENAIQVAELHLAHMPGMDKVFHGLKDDPDPRVRFQLMCTLGDFNDPGSQAIRQSLLLRDIEDRWMQVAALSGARGQEWALIDHVLRNAGNRPSEGKALFFAQAAGMIGLSQRPDDIRRLVMTATRKPQVNSEWWQAALLRGLGMGLGARGLPAGAMDEEKNMLLATHAASFPVPIQDAALELLGIIGPPAGTTWEAALAAAEKTAMDTGISVEGRAAAFKVLALQKGKDYGPMVESIIMSGQDDAVKQAALNSYRQYSKEKSATLVVKHWSSLYAPLSNLGMEILLGSSDGMRQLLDALEKQQIAAAAIPWSGKVDLMNHDDAAIRTRARALLAPGIEGREKVVAAYQPALSMKGDVNRGRAVFQAACGVCHLYEGQLGKNFGPDLGSIGNRDKASIMTDILQPNRSIAVQYDLWSVVMKNGERHSGIIHAETPTSIQLTPAGGESRTLARKDIQRMDIGNTSAMPEGLEASITHQQMADLLAFLTKRE
jgi:putative heme-binding domain-containing protein